LSDGGFQGISNDSATQPSFTWTGSTNTGMFKADTNRIAFTTNGVERLKIGDTQISTNVPIFASGATITLRAPLSTGAGAYIAVFDSNAQSGTQVLRTRLASDFSLSTHGHGNITSAGVVSTNTAPATGQHLLITNSSNAVEQSNITFDTTNTTAFLRQDGTWQVPAGGGGGATDLSVGTVTSTNVPILSSTGADINTLPAATGDLAGILTAGTQTIGGAKTFEDGILTGSGSETWRVESSSSNLLLRSVSGGSPTTRMTLSNTGVISTSTWNGATIASSYGGTGLTSFVAANRLLYSTSSSALTTLPIGSNNQVLTVVNGSPA
jgi:hypothetical protein